MPEILAFIFVLVCAACAVALLWIPEDWTDRRTARRAKEADRQLDALQAEVKALKRTHHEFASDVYLSMQLLQDRINQLEERNKP